MTLAIDGELAPLLEKLGPYARGAVDHAAAVALHLHADELTPEHLLVSVLEDEECGATRLVLHAFGDPETIGIEVLALCPGIMVVGSERSLPFSAGGVELLERARASAAERGDRLVDLPHLYAAAAERLPEEAASVLRAGGPSPRDSGRQDSGAGDEESVAGDGPLFRFFAQEARKALGAACRQATRLDRDEISPVHLVLGCLSVDDEFDGAARVRSLLRGHDTAPSRRARREIPADAGLRRLLGTLPTRAGTVQILGWIIAHGGDEVRALLHRQRITPKLLEHAGKSFEDPATPRAST